MLKIHPAKFGTVATLCLEGRIVIGETAGLLKAARCQVGVGIIVLDLARVTLIDAAGLGVLLGLREETQSKGVRLMLMNVSERVSQVLEITRLNSVFEVAASTYSPCSPGADHQFESARQFVLGSLCRIGSARCVIQFPFA
jgi:anti-sigma B factor antagonist